MRAWARVWLVIATVLGGGSLAAPAVEAGVDIRVNLAAQTLVAITPDGEARRYTISSGRQGYPTIRGNFRPYLLKPYHWSQKYGGAMPHAIFFKGGFAIHGTSAVGRLGQPASHGCIRLAPGAARELYALVKKHGQSSTRIAIHGDAPGVNQNQYAATPRPKAVAAKRSAEPEDIRTARARAAAMVRTVSAEPKLRNVRPAAARGPRYPQHEVIWVSAPQPIRGNGAIVVPGFAPIDPSYYPGYQRVWQRLR